MTNAKLSWQQQKIAEIRTYLAYKKADQESEMLRPLIDLLDYFDTQIRGLQKDREREERRLEDVLEGLRAVDARQGDHAGDIREIQGWIEDLRNQVNYLEDSLADTKRILDNLDA